MQRALIVLVLLIGCGSDEDGGCSTDDDCASLDDGNRCNAAMRCVLGSCVAGAAPVKCTAVACHQVACNPATGACDAEVVPDGSVCDDRDPCSVGESCLSGTCGGGAASCADDGDPCTTELCIATTGACEHIPVPALGACDDGDACTSDDRCLGGVCSGNATVCPDDGDPCTVPTCSPTGACAPKTAPDGTACDDGDACTSLDACLAGTCTGGLSPCPAGACEAPTCDPKTGACGTTPLADGTQCDDGSACTKLDACQAGACVGGASPCPPSASPCLVAFCNPATGACLEKLAPGAIACDDEDACTTSDTCTGGSCVGAPVDCPSDGQSCTTEACDPETGECVATPHADDSPCEDGSLCTASDYCVSGVCVPLTPKCPDDGSSCTKEVCDPASGACGVVLVPNGGACDDGNPCTAGDACADLVCQPGGAVTCPPDADPCTAEACSSAKGGCVALPSPEGSTCEDGDLCSLGETCQSGTCLGGAPIDCQSGAGPCSVAYCSPSAGCVVAGQPDGTPCDDDDACTAPGACEAGACTAAPVACPPASSACVTVSCDASLGCLETPIKDGQPCDDQSVCTPETTCQGGACTGKSKLCPPSGDPCLVAVCDPITAACGLGASTNGTACDDGDPCTALDGCLESMCTGGTDVACGPGEDACAPLACDPGAGGCMPVPVADGTPCEQDSKCSTGGACQGGHCSGVPIVACPAAATPCEVVACDPATGACVTGLATDGAACDDGEPCTAATTCLAGACQGGAPTVCESDGNACTAESCVAGEGCRASAANDGAACDDGDPCTLGTTCSASACQGGTLSPCDDDGDPCTSDACLSMAGCTHPPGADGEPCDDGSACTSDDACQGGACVASGSGACPEPQGPCEVAVCDPKTGDCLVEASPEGAPCSDASVCTTNDTCQAGACAGEPVLCLQDDDPCTWSVCDDSVAACVDQPAPLGTPCDDGLPCTIDDGCDGEGTCDGGALPCPEAPGPCQEAVCIASTGECTVLSSADGAPCDDGKFCEGDDFCLQGTCAGGGSPTCVASGPCRDLACDEASGTCTETVTPDAIPCDDGNPCSFAEACAAGECTGGKALPCPETPDPCTSSACDPSTGLCFTTSATPGAPCEDGNPCTEGDVCVQGGCSGIETACPAPSEPCRIAACNPATVACEELPIQDGVACDDGEVCTTKDACSGGACLGKPLVCPEPTSSCLAATCVAAAGCVTGPANDGEECDDSPCFVATTCEDGSCVGGQPLACPDPGLPCRVASCSEAKGCTTEPGPDAAPCSDGDACTTGDQCVGGQCLGAALDCEDAGPCAVAKCDPVEGCIAAPEPNGTACDDGNPCTVSDACQSGACAAGAAKPCAGGSTCEPEVCAPSTAACAKATADAGTPCDDGDPCNVGETCAAGVCGGGDASAACCTTAADCDDGTPCTVDACTAGRCAHSLADLPACIGRIVVAGEGDGELTILDARTLSVVPSAGVSVPGKVRALAAAPSASIVYAAASDHTGPLLAFDPFQPGAAVPAPAMTGATARVAVDDDADLVIVLRENGAAAIHDTRTGALVTDGLALPPGPGAPSLDRETHRLYVPTAGGWLAALDMVAGAAMAGSPYPVGGGPVAAAVDASLERVLLADPQAQALRVLSLAAGAALADDPRTGFGAPSSLDVDPGTGRVFVAYPAGNTVRAFDLVDLEPSTPPSVGLPGAPRRVRVDALTGRLLIVGAEAASLHVLSTETLAPVAGSPVSVAAGPVDAVVLWARPGPIVVTEAMIHPTAALDADGEWIELHNPGTAPVALDGWQLETEDNVHTIASGGTLAVPPGGYAVLCRNGNAAANGGVACGYTYGPALALDDGGVIVTLRRPGGLLVDRAAMLAPIAGGKSLALRHPGYENGRRSSWSTSPGTPGEANADVQEDGATGNAP